MSSIEVPVGGFEKSSISFHVSSSFAGFILLVSHI
jgi:hypothetical protein